MKSSSQVRAQLCRIAVLVLLAASLGTLVVQAQDAITVGVVMPTTGREAKPGQYQREGFELAIKQIIEAGGIMVKD